MAALAGVSITTVSHTLNGTRFVDPATADRVLRAASTLAYAPNRIAQGLRTGNSHTIAVLGISTTDPYFAEVIRGIEERSYARGYEVFLGFVEYPRPEAPSSAAVSDEEIAFHRALLSGRYDVESPSHGAAPKYLAKETDIVAKFLARNVDGFILNPGLPDKNLADALGKISQPIVLFQRSFQDVFCDFFSSDDYAGLGAALNRLFELGHRRIAMVYGYSYPGHSVRDRYRVWVDAHAKAGLATDANLLRRANYDLEEARRATTDLLSSVDPPTAIVFWSDLMATAGLRAAEELGLSVPRDVSIVGFDDLDFVAYLNPPLSSIRQDRLKSGFVVADALIDRVEAVDSGPPRRIVLPTQFVERKSTGPAPPPVDGTAKNAG